ncbi:PREDICTED: hemicentin-1-like isoform X1 [Acropora digitifera]|uniref:hemicentin-1-like isoform X1 n=1 Tax=Acropora digitifera TaxID=70779 RepID=UPI00077A62D8|nr:PREDICTED: hemicentin-1-like isoform X1 [Acropora digitifera]XP_015762742.1 PREDICTED: hemicentin-1-like isoform X1 [Acropora digitifera]XP_015762743.1 PREDICTED: hemicentin-1-like isoform X1 [Acropora digitifera]
MFYYQVLGILLSVSLRMHQSESYCKIYPAETRLGPSSSDVTLGGLNCSSTFGVNFASSSWIRNGTAIERKYIQENKEKIWTAVSFVNFSTAEDGETFECQISYPNNGGTSKCRVTLGKPRLRKLEPKIFDESNNPVDNIQWKCVIESGWPIPILSWWKDGSEISNGDFGKTRYIWYSKDKKVLTLSILRLNGLHHGKYTCRAENMFGNSTENTRLLINRHEMIRFRPDLKTTEILEGQNITLECICSAKECLEQPASSAYWRFNDRDISPIERRTFLHKVTEGHVIISLIIRNVSQLDDGSYLCGINTSKGFDEASKRLHVVTRDMFPRVWGERKEVSAHLYSPAFFRCSVIYPSVLKRAPNPFWIKDNKSSLDPQHYKQDNFLPKEGPDSTRILSFQLTISNVTLKDYGGYSCGATINIGRSVIHPFQNLILMEQTKEGHGMIRFRPDLKTIEILEGQNITLECICSAKECLEQPASSAYWRFNDRDISPIERRTFLHKVTGGHVIISLIIRNVSQLDDGSYLCGINTSKGFDEASKRLHVVTRDMFPRVWGERKEVSAHLYSLAVFICSVIYPSVLKRAPNLFWTKDNKSSLDPQHYKQANFLRKEGPDSTRIIDFHLIISNVTLKDYGGYSCGAKINIGRSVIHLFQNLTLMKQITVSGGVTDKKDWLGTNENSPDTLSLIAAGSAAVGFAMGVIFVAYKMCQSRGYTWKSFFDVPVDSLSCQFQYDVFITFSSQDSNWVKKELIPLVEKHNLNYCIYDRDFEVGKPVVDNAAHSVYTSRKVLAVMSHNYMSSEFCRGELEMALYRCAKMGDPCVIVIRIDSIDLRKMPKALRNRTFLDYYDLIERKTWKERLIKYLKPPPFVETVISSQKIHGFTENNFQNYASV